MHNVTKHSMQFRIQVLPDNDHQRLLLQSSYTRLTSCFEPCMSSTWQPCPALQVTYPHDGPSCCVIIPGATVSYLVGVQ